MAVTHFSALVLAQRECGRLKSLLIRQFLSLFGIEIPNEVRIGSNLKLPHRGAGVVINPNTVIGSRVTIYQRVTIARADSWVPVGSRTFRPIVIQDDVVLCPGSVVLGDESGLEVGRGTVLGANSVLTSSTGEWEIWAGAPARRVGLRDDAPTGPAQG